MRLTSANYACVQAMCETMNTNDDDVAEVWNDLRDMCRRVFRDIEISDRQLDVLADYGIRRLQRWGKL